MLYTLDSRAKRLQMNKIKRARSKAKKFSTKLNRFEKACGNKLSEIKDTEFPFFTGWRSHNYLHSVRSVAVELRTGAR